MAKIAILCVDRDDDLGRKAGITGPIRGKEENIEAAKKLGLADPTDSDTNAIFQAVKLYEETADAVNVFTVTGDKKGGYRADKEIADQLDLILQENDDLDGVYLVGDGSQDEQVIPIIESRIEIVSKKTTIVEQSEELEKRYYVLKEALKDPTIARIIFGLPGIILLILAIFQDLGAQIVVLGIGIYLVLKGFGIESRLLNMVRGFKETTSMSRATFPLYVGSSLSLILALWSGLEEMNKYVGEPLIYQGAGLASGFINLFLISGVLFLIGRIGDRHSDRNFRKIKKHLLTFVSLIAMWLIFRWGTSVIFGEISLNMFIILTLVAFLTVVIALALVKSIFVERYLYPRIKTGQEVYDLSGRKIGSVITLNKGKDEIAIYDERKGKRVNKPTNSVVVVRKKYITIS